MPEHEEEWNPEEEQSSLRGQGDAHDEKYWENKLTPEQYKVLREKGTEAPFMGQYVHEKADGTYACVACGNPLFSSDAKFDSGTGWPSFDQALPGAVETHADTSHGMTRTEITCARCGSHLGHIFDDGPTGPIGPSHRLGTGKRYCINSVCLDLEEK
ncbi:peptide-methionine (R)-S-oxide reductase MsrB [Candidatus Kaiserbacteria bacterium]|nr:peptide-methionine (R)-S-oxide reductase MsrB [Candidatus Kaiserbacteria bacterium]